MPGGNRFDKAGEMAPVLLEPESLAPLPALSLDIRDPVYRIYYFACVVCFISLNQHHLRQFY